MPRIVLPLQGRASGANLSPMGGLKRCPSLGSLASDAGGESLKAASAQMLHKAGARHMESRATSVGSGPQSPSSWTRTDSTSSGRSCLDREALLSIVSWDGPSSPMSLASPHSPASRMKLPWESEASSVESPVRSSHRHCSEPMSPMRSNAKAFRKKACPRSPTEPIFPELEALESQLRPAGAVGGPRPHRGPLHSATTPSLALEPGSPPEKCWSSPPPSAQPRPPCREIRHLDRGQKIYDIYHWEEVLQEYGDGGKVVICKPKSPGPEGDVEWVLKMRSKKTLQEGRFQEEFVRVQTRILNLEAHPGVLPLQEVMEDAKNYYILMPKATGGSFFPWLLATYQDGVMPEAAVRMLMKDILHAIAHVHKHGILHRDIKPDNLVVQVCNRATLPGRVCLIDFDHADIDWSPAATPPQDNTTTIVGTPAFSAPEALLGEFSQQSDLYSVGVILYLIMTGRMPHDDALFVPFEDEIAPTHARRQSVVRGISETSLDWQCNPWPQQPECRDLAKSLLAFSPSGRPSSADAALRHRWFATGNELSSRLATLIVEHC